MSISYLYYALRDLIFNLLSFMVINNRWRGRLQNLKANYEIVET